ncbi:MAG: CapA family protein [Betaproteobacteria bacterium]
MRSLGIDLVSRANNHATDWGVEGMRLTGETLAAAGIAFAGVGEHRAAARAARYVDTPKGRVGLVSAASSYTEMSDLYERFGLDPAKVSAADFLRMWTAREFDGEPWYRSVVAVSRFAQGRVSQIRLYPIDLDHAARHGIRGVPRLAAPAVARAALEDLQRLSQPFGTRIVIEGDVGLIAAPGGS